MILRSKDVVDQLAPHYGIAASAVIAAASVAAQQAQAAAQRRAQQRAAQEAKQGMAADGSSGGGLASVAQAALGQVGQNKDRLVSMFNNKTTANGVASQLDPPAIPQGQSAAPMMQQQNMGLQQAMGGQQPDLQELLKQLNAGSVGGF